MTDEPTGSIPLVDDSVELYDHEADEREEPGAEPQADDAYDDGDEMWGHPDAGGASSPRRGAPSRARGRRDRRRTGRNWTVAVIAAIAITAVVGILISAGWLYWKVHQPFSGSGGSEQVEVVIRPGWGTAEVADVLADQGVIDSKLAFRIWAQLQGATFQAGTYSLPASLNIGDAVEHMERAPDTPLAANQTKLLVPPGLTLSQIADRVGALPGHSRDAFLATARSGVVRSKYQPAGVTSLEGLTWPDTYFVGEHQTDEQILRVLVDAFDQHADAVGLGTPRTSGWSPEEAVVVASLVQGEAGGPDQPTVAGVILNRLRRGMPLQIDATLCYAKGGCPPVPTNADKQIDSPYNTYRVTGLPPTPILTVTESALRAALAPASHEYLYYVTGDDGVTRFATTFVGHEQNIREHGVRGE